VTDDEDAQSPAGEFPPGLEALSAEIERLTNTHSDAMQRIAQQAAPLVDEARRALAAAHGNTDDLPTGLRAAVSALKAVAEPTLSGAGSLTIGQTTYASAGMAGVGVLAGNAVALTDSGMGTDSLEVQKSGDSVLDQLPPAHVLFTVLIWLLAVGLMFVLSRFDLPTGVVQADSDILMLALTLTVMFQNHGKRK
jgi:hypothetical protein